MNIHSIETFNNLSIKEFRDLAKSLSKFQDESKESILNVFKQNSKINPLEMFESFVDNGFLVQNDKLENGETTWSATLPLRAIAGTSLQKRKKSDKAWLEVAKALARIIALSEASGWNIETPSKIFLFGSMLNPSKKDYGDADLVVTLDAKDAPEVLLRRQDEWIYNYLEFISPKFNTSLGFESQLQLKQDITAGSTFLSLNTLRDIEYLSNEPYNIGQFPVMTIWENKEFCHKENTLEAKLALQLSELWKEKYKQTYQEVESRLNQALASLGIFPFKHVDFEKSCKDYIKLSLTEELVNKLKSNKKLNDDAKLVNRMVRLGNIGCEAIGRAISQMPDFDTRLSKVDTFIALMTQKEEKSFNKGLKHKNTIEQHKSKNSI